MTTTAAVDGSALGNPGPAGWAWFIDDARWASGGWKRATNNRGELQAIIELLRATQPGGEDLRILCDSQYAINSITKWMPGWKKRGWKKADGKPVLNADLMQELDALMHEARAAGRSIAFEWVKGHSGHRLNERADALARAAAGACQEGRQPDAGPGFGTADAPAGRVRIWTEVSPELADELAARAGAVGQEPHEYLRGLIEEAMSA